jgi:hypothetical protein
VDCALIEGQIAGHIVADQAEQARRLIPIRDRYRRFADALNRTFALRAELKTPPPNKTILCRCEDVTWDRVAQYTDWRSAKLHTRCGMGPCQGRICGGALGFYRGWQNESPRPPIFPVKLESLAQIDLAENAKG